jgi:subtilase family serine protease
VAYGVDGLIALGLTGKGRTIAVVDSFGSPTIQHDLQVWDKAFGLPDPSLSILQPVGPVPRFDPQNGDMVLWAEETTLDVELAHAMAPGASIDLLETPVDETQGITGVPEMMKAEKYAIDHGIVDVISQSWSTTEQDFSSTSQLDGQRFAFKDAARHGVTVLASSGDFGATGLEVDNATVYPYRVVQWPASDPLVTGVGGTTVLLDAKGNRIQPDVGWGGSGGGTSSVFTTPVWQRSQSVVGSSRGVPDVSLDADPGTGPIIYQSFPGSFRGFSTIGGTSVSCPLMAGLVAIADQIANRRLGTINPALYRLQRSHSAGVTDILTGNNSFGTVVGYQAGAGYDLVTGLGSPVGSSLLPSLAAV